MVLLYEPSPLDVWIGKKIEQQSGGALVNAETGGTLTRQETKQYKAYCKRHTARNEEARLADKLFHIVDKYLPLQADETRAYTARFPGEVHTAAPKGKEDTQCSPTTRGTLYNTTAEARSTGKRGQPKPSQ